MRVLPLLVSGLGAMFAGSAAAQTPLGGEFRVNETTIGQQVYPGVAADALGNFVVVWASGSGYYLTQDVFARRFDAAGNPLGGEFQVNTYTTGGQSLPAVASDAAGNLVVVWESLGQDGSSYGVFGRRFDAAGNPTSAEFIANTYTTFEQKGPSVAMTADGGFVVVWASDYQDGRTRSIFGQRFDAAAQRVGDEFLVNTYTNANEYGASVAAAGSGFVVAWSSFRQKGPGSAYGVFARRFDGAGQPLGADFQVNTVTAGHQFGPAVAGDRTGAFIVTWSHYNVLDVSGQRYDPSGARVGGEFRVNSFLAGSQKIPATAVDANGNLIAAWESVDQDGNVHGVAARRFDCDGQALGPDFVANTYTTSDQELPAIAATAGGDFVVTWMSNGQDGSGGGIYAQRYRGQPACGRFYAVPPCRLVDTRDPPATPLAANSTRTFQMSGSCAIPTSAKAVVLNVTAVAPTDLGNLRLYPAGEAVPLASTISFAPSQTRANSAMVGLGASGQIDVQCDMPPGSAGRTHLVVDTTGYFR